MRAPAVFHPHARQMSGAAQQQFKGGAQAICDDAATVRLWPNPVPPAWLASFRLAAVSELREPTHNSESQGNWASARFHSARIPAFLMILASLSISDLITAANSSTLVETGSSPCSARRA